MVNPASPADWTGGPAVAVPREDESAQFAPDIEEFLASLAADGLTVEMA